MNKIIDELIQDYETAKEKKDFIERKIILLKKKISSCPNKINVSITFKDEDGSNLTFDNAEIHNSFNTVYSILENLKRKLVDKHNELYKKYHQVECEIEAFFLDLSVREKYSILKKLKKLEYIEDNTKAREQMEVNEEFFPHD